MSEIPQYLDERQVARMIGRAVQTLRNDRHKGQGLPYVKFGRLVRYSVQDVHVFMESHRVEVSNL
jgi:hypothetical protein